MSGDFETRQVVVAHQSFWNALEQLAKSRGFELVQIPNGTDESGKPILDNPDDLPTYAFMPEGS